MTREGNRRCPTRKHFVDEGSFTDFWAEIRFVFLIGASLCITGCGSNGGSASAPTSPAPTITSVSVTCALSTVPTGQTSQCSGTVSGTGGYDSSLNWSVSGISGGNTTVGTVTSGGLYTAPNAVPTPYTISITATSVADSTKSSSVSVIVAGTIATSSQPISSTSGGVITLPDGSSVTIAPNVLPADQTLTLSEVSYLPHQPANSSITGVGPGLVLTFSTPVQPSKKAQIGAPHPILTRQVPATAGSTIPSAFAFTIKLGQNNDVNGLSGSIPAVNLVDQSSNNTFMGAAGSYDSTAEIASTNFGSDQWQAILSVASNGIQSITATMVNFTKALAGDVYNVVTAPHELELTVNSSGTDTWTNFSQQCPVGHTLLVVHGMNDYVEQGFSTGTKGDPQIIQPIVQAGGYSVQGHGVLGFDYDWLQSINTSGQQLASFLNAITNCPGATLDIEAHSEGVPVTLSALSQMNLAQRSAIKRLIALGGPIMGTPMANDSRALSTILMAASALNLGNDVVLNGLADLLNSPFAKDLQVSTPGSGDKLDTIRSSLASQSSLPQIIVVAGNYPQAAPANPIGLALQACAALMWAPPNPVLSDGFIPVTSALAFQPGVEPTQALRVFPFFPFSTDHLDLIKSPDIVKSVGSLVNATSALPTLEITSSQCSGNLVCSGDPGTIFSFSGDGYGISVPNAAYRLDQTGTVVLQTTFASTDGSIPAGSWLDATDCTAPQGSLMFFSANSQSLLQSNAVTTEVASGTCVAPSISVSPNPVQVPVNSTQQFSYTVANISNTVAWSVNGTLGGNTTNGTISTTGLYTAPGTVPASSTIVITATSQVDPNVSGSALATITPPPSAVVISPSNVTMPTGAVQTFSASVGGGGGVTWSITGGPTGGPTGGTISGSGIYTAPNQTGTYSVIATNAANTSETATATVNVVAGPSIKTLHSFDHSTEGAIPWGGPVFGSDGYLYGTTEAGGDLSCSYIASLAGCGSIYKADTAGNVTTLHQFSGLDGAYPSASLLQTPSGAWYGTTEFGGTNTSDCMAGGTSTFAGCGALFSVDASQNFNVLYSFGPYSAAVGVGPDAALIQAADGSIYGASLVGGSVTCGGSVDGVSEPSCGTIFQLDSLGIPALEHSFSGSDGAYPAAALLQMPDGNFYGTTVGGGDQTCSSYASPGCGTVFQMTASGAVKVLHSFAQQDGAAPDAQLIVGKDGQMYGTTLSGGSTSCSGGASWSGCGTVFKIDTAGNFTPLHSFSGPDGAYPAQLVQASDGYFYGTTESGGDTSCTGPYGPGCGTVFRMDAAGNVTVLYAFTGQSDGSWPESALVQGTDGNLYGTTAYGGTNDDGVIFQISNLAALAATTPRVGTPQVVKPFIAPRQVTRPHIALPRPAQSLQH